MLGALGECFVYQVVELDELDAQVPAQCARAHAEIIGDLFHGRQRAVTVCVELGSDAIGCGYGLFCSRQQLVCAYFEPCAQLVRAANLRAAEPGAGNLDAGERL